MMKSVLAASAMLIALCSAASAHPVKHRHAASVAAMQLSEADRDSFAFAPVEKAGTDAHQYHGGPKAND